MALLPAALLSLVLGGQPARAQTASGPFPSGKSLVEADINGTVLQLYAYRPASYTGEGFILLLHGASRAAESYRDNAMGMAETYNASWSCRSST